MNKEVNDALHTLLNLSLKDKSFSTQKQQFKIVYDYITNLQTIEQQYSAILSENAELQRKVNQYENPDDLTLFYMWLDEKAKDKMKELQDEIQNFRGSLKTYEILLKTNVEENERLKELCNKYEEEHNTKFNEWVFDKRENEKLKEQIKNIEQRNYNQRKANQELIERNTKLDANNRTQRRKRKKQTHKKNIYKSRCEKAIEYLKKEKENYLTKGVSLADTNIGQLIVSAAVNTCSCGLNILTGGDKE